MPIWEAILLGIVQGLTEFLPISSTAHLLVTRQLLGHKDPKDGFTTAIQLGTLVAVLWYFRRDIVRLFFAFLLGLIPGKATNDSRLGWKIIAGTVPVVVAGFTLRGQIKEHLYTMPVMGGAAIVFAFLMWEAEVVARARVNRGDPGRNEEEITWWDAILIGLFQSLALIPGASRSGCTITAALLVGLARPTAARFSFLLSLPAIFGAGLYELYKDRDELLASPEQRLPLIVGGLTAAIVGYAAIAWLMTYLKGHTTLGFVVYRLLFGSAIILLLLTKVISA
ncbi:undecaprenyl-diphosphatase UppP [Zavarzinella formosa]|uniref:undecaprenyl-diphosphatase UppP n=1 Tax=Zavarzinella formosa TaxID=360055 RepID=UPI0003038B5F|nr:undecaprenyl-diphosphatase UppP [Zavarzinella formosa]